MKGWLPSALTEKSATRTPTAVLDSDNRSAMVGSSAPNPPPTRSTARCVAPIAVIAPTVVELLRWAWQALLCVLGQPGLPAMPVMPEVVVKAMFCS